MTQFVLTKTLTTNAVFLMVTVGGILTLQSRNNVQVGKQNERFVRSTCSSGWTDVTGSGLCTMNVDSPLNWWDAHLDCVLRGGFLSTKDDITTPLGVSECPTGSNSRPNLKSCYELTSNHGNITMARNYCQSKGGDVPDISSSEEIQEILEDVVLLGIPSPRYWFEGFWIGQHRVENTWRYLSNESVTAYIDWAPGEAGSGINNNCSVLIYDNITAPTGSYGKMLGVNCDKLEHKIMCEYKIGAWIGALWDDTASVLTFINSIILPSTSVNETSPINKCILERDDGSLDAAYCDSLHPYVCTEGTVDNLASTIIASIVTRVSSQDIVCPVVGSPNEAFYANGTGSCYWLTTDKGDWDTMQSACTSVLNASLAVIASTEEALFVYKKVLEKDETAGAFTWIGIQYLNSIWVDNNDVPITYTNWNGGLEPTTQRCAAIGRTYNGQWDSQLCSLQFRGICKLQVVYPTRHPPVMENIGDMNCSIDEPDFCIQDKLDTIDDLLQNGEQPINEHTVPVILDEVMALILSSHSLSSKSIDTLVNITSVVSEVAAGSQETVEEILDIGDIILDDSNQAGLVNDASPETLSHFLTTMDNFVSLIASGGVTTSNVIAMDNLDLYTKHNVKAEYGDYYMEFAGDGYTSAVSLSRSLFNNEVDVGSIAILVFKSLHDAVSKTLLDDTSPEDEIFNSHIYAVSFVLDDEQELNFAKGAVTFTFKRVEDINREQRCSFWSPDKSIWSSEGCELVVEATNETHTVCRCNHLTNFAVLMQYRDVYIGGHEDILEYMTYIGISLSVICLIMTLLIYLRGKLFKSQRIIIHANLATCLLVGQVLFIGGVDAVHNKFVCVAVACMLHYFFLAAFSWMLAEGVHLYMKSAMIFGKDVKTWTFFLLGWGLPAVVVSITFAVRHEGYGEEGSGKCWLSIQHGMTWAFIGPVLAIILANTIVLALVIRVFMTLKANADKSEIQRVRVGIRAILMLLPLLGLSWLFGLLGVNKETVVFQYLFVLCNSLQGMFIFLCHCISNDEVKSIFVRRYKKMLSTVNTVPLGSGSSATTEMTQHTTTPKSPSQGSTCSKKAWI